MITNTVIVKSNRSKEVLDRLRSRKVVAGFLANSGNYPTGESVVHVAYKNEYGIQDNPYYTSPRGREMFIPDIPERPFMHETAKANRGEWKASIAKAAKKAIRNQQSLEKSLEILGSKMQKEIKATIVGWTEPDNCWEVIYDKGRNDPLVDTGRMKNSVSYEVREL